MMKVPLLDLKAQYETIRSEIDTAIRETLETQQFILGASVEALEERVAAYVGVQHAVGVSSGTDALLVSLWALGVGADDLVVVPTYSFFATAGVVVRLGARPVFVDIDPATYNLDPSSLERTVANLPKGDRSRIRAIVPVHLFGQCAEMHDIVRAAGRLDAVVIEDAAQAIGARYRDGRPAGSIGTVGCFSFFPTKNLGAYGDAGLVTTDDPDLARQMRLLRGHGAEPKYHHSTVGGNFRLDALQAAVLLAKLGHLDRWTDLRRERAERYDRLFADSGLTATGRVRTPLAAYRSPGATRDHVYNQYVIRAGSRDALRDFLRAEGIQTEVYYPVPFHMQVCFRDLGYREGDFPVGEAAARDTVALPVFPEMTPDQQEYVVSRIKAFYRG